MRDYEIAFSIRDGHASYPGRVIFDKFNWTIRKGECWALTGPNGSGKSLLLSMICADNPQGYANDIILFDRKRGTGESIWDIKELIGYMSPEMQNYFRTQDSVKQIVLQGLRNSINRFKPISEVEKESIDFWLQAIKISDLADRPFSSLSSGEQRLVLLARALIGQPELLVLDEPFHGLDSENIYNLQRLISSLVRSNRTSLIFVSHHPEEFPDCITHYKSMTTLMKQV